MSVQSMRGGTLAAACSPHGPWAFQTRPDATADLPAIVESWTEDVYGVDRIDWSLRSGRRPVVIDLGAHIGALAARAAQAGARVIAVEADDDNASICHANTAGLDVAVIRAAVAPAGHVGPARITPLAGTGMGHVTFGADDDGGTVATVTIDGLIADHDAVALLKVDIEGGEYAVLTSAPHDLLARCAVIAVETHPTDPATLGALLAHLGETHTITYFGHAAIGGQIEARAY